MPEPERGPLDPTRAPRTARRPVMARRDHRVAHGDEIVVVEEPLEIRVNDTSLAVVMRTPGDDIALASGLLFTEGIVRAARDVARIAHCLDQPSGSEGNVVLVRLRDGLVLDLEHSKRHLLVASSCGLCGKASLAALRQIAPPLNATMALAEATLLELPARMRAAQSVFAATGGLHAAGLFDAEGKLLTLKEDIGRHNAVDKVIGEALRVEALPLERAVLLVSGRSSFEIVQKARMARIPIIASVSAPSSLAIDLAMDGQQTLIGFLRDGRYNVYAGEERVMTAGPRATRPPSVVPP